MDRRALLAALGASLGAGCVGPGANDTGRPTPTAGPAALDGHVRPEDDPETVPEPLTCESARFERRISFEDAPRWGDAAPFALRTGLLTYDYGETVDITLTNTGERTVTTGVKAKHQFQVSTEAGWQSVGGSVDGNPLNYIDLGISLEPDDTLEWTLELTERGLSDPQPGGYGVCPDLQTGRYRFVFWGVGQPLAVAFALRRGG